MQVAGKLIIGNAGDCRAVLCHGEHAVPLTRDHTAEDEYERDRIEHSGGQLKQINGQWRVGSAGLQVCQSCNRDCLCSRAFAGILVCGKHSVICINSNCAG